MKKVFLSLVVVCFSLLTFAQGQAETYINEALNYVKAKNYKQAQMSLQDAINEINNELAQQIIGLLPEEINGLKANKSDDNTNSSAMGMMGGGMTISRKYAAEDNKVTAEVSIIANSPMISSLSMFINNPALMSSSGNQKSVRVGTRRAMLKKDNGTSYDDNGNSKDVLNFELSVLLGQTLVTVKGDSFDTEQTFIAFYQKIDFEKLAKALGEN